MTPINPFSGYLAQGTQVERAQAADKSNQIKRTQQLSKNIAVRDDEMEHQVESSDAISAVKDQNSHPQQNPSDKKKHRDEDSEPADHLDIRA